MKIRNQLLLILALTYSGLSYGQFYDLAQADACLFQTEIRQDSIQHSLHIQTKAKQVTKKNRSDFNVMAGRVADTLFYTIVVSLNPEGNPVTRMSKSYHKNVSGSFDAVKGVSHDSDFQKFDSTHYLYDVKGRIHRKAIFSKWGTAEESHSKTDIEQYNYDERGNHAEIIFEDDTNNRITKIYDENNRWIFLERYKDNKLYRRDSISHDTLKHTSFIWARNGDEPYAIRKSAVYNEQGRLTESRSSGTNVFFAYDLKGNVVQCIKNERDLRNYTYDESGNCIHEELFKIKDPEFAEETIVRKFNASNLLISETVTNHRTRYFSKRTEYKYLSSGLLSKITVYKYDVSGKEFVFEITDFEYIYK